MDIKEFKTNLINEIRSKLATVIDRPDFEKIIIRNSHEYRQRCGGGREHEYILRSLKDDITYLHFPLLMVLNPTHEYTKRYVNHLIEFNYKDYLKATLNNIEVNIKDFTDIVNEYSSYGSVTRLNKRSVETLLGMNMAIMSYDEVKNFTTNEESMMQNKLNEMQYCSSNNIICKIVDFQRVPKHNGFNITYLILCQDVSSTSFGEFKNKNTTFWSFSHIKNNVKSLTLFDVNKALSNDIDTKIKRDEKRIKELEKEIESKNTNISRLKQKQKKYENG